MLLRAVLALAAAATARSGSVERVEHSASEMVRIPVGEFTMGFDDDDDETERNQLLLACVREFGAGSEETYCREELLIDNALPAREVFLPAFEIDRYEVTVAQYRECATKGGCDVAALLAGDGRYIRDDSFPMVYVAWQDAVDYCAWVGKRLPTEAEFEKASRGDDARRWPWGNHERDDGANHGGVERDVVRGPIWGAVHYVSDDIDGHDGPAARGTMKWTDSGYGVYDLSGNASEWVADYYREGYAGLSMIDPVMEAPPEGQQLRVYRGGSWAEPKLFGRTYFRLFADPEQRSFDRGFRCARDVD